MGPHIRPPGHSRRPPPTTERSDREPPLAESATTSPAPANPQPFIPVGFHLDIPNPFHRDLTTQPNSTSIFRPSHSMTQGATGMVPVEAPTTPSNSAPPLENRSEVDRLEDQIKAEIRTLRQRLGHAHRNSNQDFRRFNKLMELSTRLGQLKIAGQIHSTGFRNLLTQARQLLLEGEVRRNSQRQTEGVRIATATWNYYQAHRYRQNVISVLQDQYPHSSRGLQTDYAQLPEGERNPNDPSAETLNNSAILRTYRSLSNSSNPEERAAASAFSGAIAEINHHQGLGENVTLEQLQTATQLYQNIYGSPAQSQHPLQGFLNRVQGTQQRDLEQNPGFQSRQRLEQSLSALQSLQQMRHILRQAATENMPPLVVQETREEVLRRLEASDRTIQEEITRLKNNPTTHQVRYQEGGHWITEDVADRTPTSEQVRLERFHHQILEIQNRLRRLSNTHSQANSELAQIIDSTLELEEAQTRILMQNEIRDAHDPSIARTLDQVQATQPNFANLDVRLEHYSDIVTRLDTSLIKASVQARIDMYTSMLPQVQSTDRTIGILSAGMGGEVDFVSHYREMIHRYERIAQAIDQGHLTQARRDFIRLEQAQAGQDLQDHFTLAGHVQTGVALGIIAASAATMNAAGLLLLPETALAIEAGEATLGMRLMYAAATAPAFQLTHYGLSDLFTGTHHLYDPQQSARENLARYGEDYVRNVGNNAVIGETLRFVQQSAFTRLAERQLMQEGALANRGIYSAAERLLIQTRASRIAQDGLTSTAVSATALGPELVAVQAWGFLDRNLTDAAHGRFNIGQAAQETVLNPQSWKDQAIFILGMRVGHLTTTPVLGHLHRTARDIATNRVRGRYDEALQASQEAGRAWNRYITNGEGRGADIRTRLLQAVEARQRLEQHSAIRDLVSPEQHAETQRLVNALEQAKDMRLSNPYRDNSLLGLGFIFTGADTGNILSSTPRPGSGVRRRNTAQTEQSNNPTLLTVENALAQIDQSQIHFNMTRVSAGTLKLNVDPQNANDIYEALSRMAQENGLEILSNHQGRIFCLAPANDRNNNAKKITIRIIFPPPINYSTNRMGIHPGEHVTFATPSDIPPTMREANTSNPLSIDFRGRLSHSSHVQTPDGDTQAVSYRRTSSDYFIQNPLGTDAGSRRNLWLRQGRDLILIRPGEERRISPGDVFVTGGNGQEGMAYCFNPVNPVTETSVQAVQAPSPPVASSPALPPTTTMPVTDVPHPPTPTSTSATQPTAYRAGPHPLITNPVFAATMGLVGGAGVSAPFSLGRGSTNIPHQILRPSFNYHLQAQVFEGHPSNVTRLPGRPASHGRLTHPYQLSTSSNDTATIRVLRNGLEVPWNHTGTSTPHTIELREGDVIERGSRGFLGGFNPTERRTFQTPGVPIPPPEQGESVFGRSIPNFERAAERPDIVSSRHMTLTRLPDGNIYVRNGAVDERGTWKNSTHGLELQNSDGSWTPLANGRPSQPPSPYVLSPGQTVRLRTGNELGYQYFELENPSVIYSTDTPYRRDRSIFEKNPALARLPVIGGSLVTPPPAASPPLPTPAIELTRAQRGIYAPGEEIPGVIHTQFLPIPAPGQTTTLGRDHFPILANDSISRNQFNLQRAPNGTLTINSIGLNKGYLNPRRGVAIQDQQAIINEPITLYPGESCSVMLGNPPRIVVFHNPLPPLRESVSLSNGGGEFRQSIYRANQGIPPGDVFTPSLTNPNRERVSISLVPVNTRAGSADSRTISIPREEALRLGWIMPTENGYQVHPNLENVHLTAIEPTITGESPPISASPLNVQPQPVPASSLSLDGRHRIQTVHFTALDLTKPLNPAEGVAAVAIRPDGYTGPLGRMEYKEGRWHFRSNAVQGRPIIAVQRRILTRERSVPLNHGDIIDLGGTQFQFLIVNESPQLIPLTPDNSRLYTSTAARPTE